MDGWRYSPVLPKVLCCPPVATPVTATQARSNRVSWEFVGAYSCSQTRHSSPSGVAGPLLAHRIDGPSAHVPWRSLYIDKAIRPAFLPRRSCETNGVSEMLFPTSCSLLGGWIRETAWGNGSGLDLRLCLLRELHSGKNMGVIVTTF